MLAALLLLGLTGHMNLSYVLIHLLVIEYLILYTLNNLFVYHDIFISECGSFTGKELETHLFHNNLGAIDFSAKSKVAVGLLFILPIVLFLWCITVLKTGHRISFTAGSFIMLFLICLFFILFNQCCLIVFWGASAMRFVVPGVSVGLRRGHFLLPLGRLPVRVSVKSVAENHLAWQEWPVKFLSLEMP